MKIVGLICLSISVCGGGQMQSSRNAPPPADRFVVVGDSLSAGLQNFSLLDTQQPNGYASVIARQAGWNLTLPLVPFPGIPSVLQLVSVGPPVVIQPASGNPTTPRDNPGVQPTNIAVPGLTVGTALTLRPSLTATSPEQQWATVVLGFPSLLQGKAPTEIEMATSLHPKTLIEWLGNNDALVPALTGQISTLTPVDQFAIAYEQVLDALVQTGANLITATIPDVTEVAYFTSAQTIAQGSGLKLDTVTAMLGIGPNDYVRPSAQAYVDAILVGKMQGPLPASCPPPLPDLGVDTLPCVLSQKDATTIRSFIDSYNQTIVLGTMLHGGVVVDIHALVDQIHGNGYQVGDQLLTTNFLGGLFSLDGIHPTNTGYGVIANEFIKTMNTFLGKSIPPADIPSIFATDPLAKYVTPQTASAAVHASATQTARP